MVTWQHDQCLIPAGDVLLHRVLTQIGVFYGFFVPFRCPNCVHSCFLAPEGNP